MKGVIVYDSRYGNTKKIAFAIRDGLLDAAGAALEVEVIHASMAEANQFAGGELLLVGGPTQGTMPSPAVREFLTRLLPSALAGVSVAAFDTRTDPERQQGVKRFLARIFDRFGYAAPKILAALEKHGGHVVRAPEGFIVLDMEGPLQEGELQRARQWAREILAHP
jgi:flavodoxin